MDIKSLLKNPEQVINDHWGSIESCTERDQILDGVKNLRNIQGDIKSLKADKQLCSKAFKEAKNDPAAIDDLKQNMQGISSQLNQLEAQKKSLEASLKAYFTANKIQEKHPPFPLQFSTVDANKDTAQGTNIAVSQVADDAAIAWNNYVSNNPKASLYHQYNWKTVIEKSFGHQSHYFAAYDNRSIVGILPTTRLTSRLFGDFGVSVPYFNYGGVLANSSAIADKLLDAASGFYRTEGSSHLEVRSTNPTLSSWPNTTDKVSMIRPLPSTTEQLDKELGTKIRAQIRRAQRENTEVAIGGRDLLDEFYCVFARNMRDLGTPVYSKTFFAHILEQYPDQANVVTIKLNQRPVAAAFLLGHRDMLEIPWASTLKEANPLSVNMQLYWEVLSLAVRKGYAYFDFGRSTKEANTYRFKKQWGAKPIQHHWYYWLKEEKELPKLKPDNPKFQLAIALWRKMPIWLTKVIGPPIVKNLP